MKHLVLAASMLCMSVFSFSQDGEKCKEYPRLKKETSKISRDKADQEFKKNLEMDIDDELRTEKSEQDQIGYTHDKFQQYYKKVKVEGAVYSAHSKNNMIESYSGEYKGIKNFDVKPTISASQGLSAAMNHVDAVTYAWDNTVKNSYPDYKKPIGELVIIGGASDDDIPLTLAWKYDIYAAEPLYRAEVYIDAKTGAFIKENFLIHNINAPSSGSTLFNGVKNFTADLSGTTYRLRQTTSGLGVETYSLGRGTNYAAATDVTSVNNTTWTDATAVQAHWGAEQTHGFFLNKLGRNSFNNAGAIIKSYVHYSTNYVNAFWDGTRMTYGDGNGTTYAPLVSLDICGHEIAHGVTSFSSNLIYSNESGALNESFSDIFGECVENYAKGSNDWLMSCDIGFNGCGAFRSMSNPNLFSHPDTYQGTHWYVGIADNGGVHLNSGVQNKWFYILTTGETGVNDKAYSYSVTGIGLDKAAKIAYRNLTVYLTATSNFAAARAGAIQSAIDLYGAGSPEVIATTEAWNAVGVFAPAPDAQAPTAATLSSTSTTQTSIALSWTASTDNVAVIGYDVFVNGVKNNATNLTARTYTVSGLTASTVYSIYVLSKDAAGNTRNSNVLSITTSGQVTETLVTSYYFPTSLEGWVSSNATNSLWTNSTLFAYEGNGSVLVQNRNTTATSPTVSLAGYSQVEVMFYFNAIGMETGKTFDLRYSSNNGTTWTTVGTFTSVAVANTTSSFVTDRGFYAAKVTMNSTAFNATARFRIQNNGANNTDRIYFDAVTIKGRTNTTATGNVVSLATATKTALLPEVISGAINNTNNDVTEITGITVFPNPVKNNLNINSKDQIKSIRILSMSGVILKTISMKSGSQSVDLSKLSKGIYIAEIITTNGSTKKKIIKQ